MSQFQALAISEFGDLNSLQVQGLAMPEPKAGQVLIKLHYASVNPIDCKTRAGLGWAAEQNKDQLPWVGGYDMAGEVIALGDERSCFSVGQKVAGMVGFPLKGGCYAQYLVADTSELVALSDSQCLQQAAALPLAGLTAMQALFTYGALQEGELVIISAAAGGVGHIAVQLAKQAGAMVIALASEKNHEFLKDLGADLVFDYHQEDFLQSIPKADLLIDLVGGKSGLALLPCMKHGARVVTVPTLSKDEICQAADEYDLLATGMLVSPDNEQLSQMLKMLQKSQLKVELAGCFPLLEAKSAQQQSETGHVRGKLVLKSELI